MARRAAVVLAVAVTAVLCASRAASAQHLVEVRGADTEYRFADWNYTWKSGAVVDLFYVGVPGSNEFNLGGGYAFVRGPLVVSPLAYAVIGREAGQRGVKVAVLVLFAQDGWKFQSFLGHYIPASGDVPSYQVLDTLDLTRTIGPRWEIGVQAGFFHVDGGWNQQVGPVVKFNDRLGAWAVSYRFGPQRELRVGRVLAF